MSSIVLSTKHIATVSDGLAHLLNHSYGMTTLTAAPDLYDALKSCSDGYGYFDNSKIFSELYRLNLAAYDGRYRNESNDDVIPCIPKDFPHLIQPLSWGCAGSTDYHWILTADYYAFSKLLSSFIYQCEEDVNRSNELLKALQNTLAEFNNFLINNTAEYISAAWMIA